MDPTHFRLLKISLIRGVGCPKELLASIDNNDRRMAMVVVGNEAEYGTSSYVPPAVLVAGGYRRENLLASGYPKSWAWVHKDLEILADDEIGSNELMQKLASLLNLRVCGREQCILGQASPYIVELYPFENYVVYDLKGQKYRQGYMLDPVERKVALNGSSVAVDEKFVNAGGPGSGRHPGTGMTHQEFGKFAEKVGLQRNENRAQEDKLRAIGNHEAANKIYEGNKLKVRQMLDEQNVTPKAFDDHMKQYAKYAGVRRPNVKMANMFRASISAGVSEAKEVMPRVNTGVRYAYAPSVANTQSSNRGALNSELMTQLVRNMTNILQAAQAYLDAIRSGLHQPMRPSFYPVDISNNKVQQVLKANKIDYFDFCRWAAAEQHKKYQTRGGTKIPKSKFAYAPGNDPSKWKLPVDTPGRARNALARVNQTQGVPSGAKSAVMSKIKRAASHHGVEVEDKPSGKQKKWLKAEPLSTL